MRSISLSSYGFRELLKSAVREGMVEEEEGEMGGRKRQSSIGSSLCIQREESGERGQENKLKAFELLISESVSMNEFLEVFFFFFFFFFKSINLFPSFFIPLFSSILFLLLKTSFYSHFSFFFSKKRVYLLFLNKPTQEQKHHGKI